LVADRRSHPPFPGLLPRPRGYARRDHGPRRSAESHQLSFLVLSNSSVTDLGPLRGLASLRSVTLDGSAHLSVIKPLLDNPEIGARDLIYLRRTRVSCGQAAALAAKGATAGVDTNSPRTVAAWVKSAPSEGSRCCGTPFGWGGAATGAGFGSSVADGAWSFWGYRDDTGTGALFATDVEALFASY
jgi:hypothetical protein